MLKVLAVNKLLQLKHPLNMKRRAFSNSERERERKWKIKTFSHLKKKKNIYSKRKLIFFVSFCRFLFMVQEVNGKNYNGKVMRFKRYSIG